MPNNIGASNQRIGQLIDDAIEQRLHVRPFFQRRLVWNNEAKENFLDTILKGYPFPEIFVAEGKREGRSTRREKMLVDGQQRLSTILDYVQGKDTILYRKISRYAELDEETQTAFLDYFVSVRDLGTASNEVIREIFNRINSTDYALKSMEILNAMFSGAYKQFCEQLSRDDFFARHSVFPDAYRKRMYDVTFCVILVTTMLSGYYKRDERNKEYLERYNEEFPQTDAVRLDIDRAFAFVEECNFPPESRAWKQTDLFTLLIEAHKVVNVEKLEIDPAAAGLHIRHFFDRVDSLYKGKRLPDEAEVPAEAQTVFAYLKAATKATNDKYSRVERGRIIAELLRTEPPAPRPPRTAAKLPKPAKSKKK